MTYEHIIALLAHCEKVNHQTHIILLKDIEYLLEDEDSVYLIYNSMSESITTLKKYNLYQKYRLFQVSDIKIARHNGIIWLILKETKESVKTK